MMQNSVQLSGLRNKILKTLGINYFPRQLKMDVFMTYVLHYRAQFMWEQAACLDGLHCMVLTLHK